MQLHSDHFPVPKNRCHWASQDCDERVDEEHRDPFPSGSQPEAQNEAAAAALLPIGCVH